MARSLHSAIAFTAVLKSGRKHALRKCWLSTFCRL